MTASKADLALSTADVGSCPHNGHDDELRPSAFMERRFRSLRLDVRELEHLCPLLGVFGDEVAEVSSRNNER